MSLQNVLDRGQGNVGDKVVHKGLTYQKAKNGKWALIMSPSLRRKIVAMTKAKATLREIAGELGVCHSTVQRVVDEEGVGAGKAELAKKHRQTVSRNKAKIKVWYLEGVSVKEIKQRLKIVGQTSAVSDFIRESGIKIPVVERVKQSVARGRHRSCFFAANSLDELLSVDLSDLDYYRYRILVRRISRFAYKEFRQVLDPDRKRSMSHHIDHQLAIFNGYHEWCKKTDSYVKRKRPIALPIIGHPVNLKLLTCKSNCQKQTQDHHTLAELKTKIKAFERKYGKPFKTSAVR